MGMKPGKSRKRTVFRVHLWAVMHDGHGRAGHAFHFLLVVLIIISVATLPLEFFPGTENLADTFVIIDGIIVGIFTVEYALRLYAAPSRLGYVFSATGIIDLLSIIPFYGNIPWGEYLRLLRLIRIFKILGIHEEVPRDKQTLPLKSTDLQEGATVEYIIRRLPLFLLFSAIPPLVSLSFGIGILIVSDINPTSLSIGIALMLFSLLFLWSAWRDFAYDVIYLTDKRLIFQNQHLLGRSINHVDYRQITNVKPYYPHALAFIFRFGSINIETAAEGTGHIQLDTVRRHEKAAHLIMQKTLR